MKKSFLQKLEEKHTVKKASVLNKPSAYKIDNKDLIYLRYSKCYTQGERIVYWYGIEKDFLLKLVRLKGYIVFILGESTNNLKVYAEDLYQMLKNKKLAKDKNWKIHIVKSNSNFELVVNRKRIELNNYLNLYKLDKN